MSSVLRDGGSPTSHDSPMCVRSDRSLQDLEVAIVAERPERLEVLALYVPGGRPDIGMGKEGSAPSFADQAQRDRGVDREHEEVDLAGPDVVSVYFVISAKGLDERVLVVHQVVEVREGRLRELNYQLVRRLVHAVTLKDTAPPREVSNRL